MGGPGPGAVDARMKFIIRKSRALWGGRAPGHRRPKARRAARSFECLEGRLLLSGADPSPKPVVVIETTHRQFLQETPAPAPNNPRGQVPTGPLSSVPVARDDSFTLPEGGGGPSIRVDLLWPEGRGPSNGHLIVSDSTGKVHYDLLLTGIEGLHAELPIPSKAGALATIDVDLQIHRPGPDEPSPGSYRVAIYDKQSLATVVPPRPPSLDTVSKPSTEPPESSWSPHLPAPDYPLISATRSLPPLSPGVNCGDQVGRPGSDNPSGLMYAPVPTSPQKAVGIPSGPSAGPAVTLTSASMSSSNPGPSLHAVQVPTTAGRGPGEDGKLLNDEGGPGSRPALVGPLPLSGSTPDGGIFAFPNGSSRGSSDPFEATFTMAPVPEADDAPIVPPSGTPRPSVDRSPPILGGDGKGRLSVAGPSEFGGVMPPLATGLAFLPPLDGLAEPVPAESRGRPMASSSPVPRPYPDDATRPRLSLEGVLIGSAWLFLGLVTPTCVARLADWQRDRPWARRSHFGAGKEARERPPES